MSAGWLNPSSIWHVELSKYIIKQDDGLGPSWEFPNATGVVLLDTTQQVLPTAQALTIAAVGGSVTPTIVAGIEKVVELTGDGGGADDLELITVPAAWIGKLIIFKKAPAVGAITVKANANIIMKTDFSLSSEYDRLICEVLAANTVVCLIRQDNA
jgi:hypothetical protein